MPSLPTSPRVPVHKKFVSKHEQSQLDAIAEKSKKYNILDDVSAFVNKIDVQNEKFHSEFQQSLFKIFCFKMKLTDVSPFVYFENRQEKFVQLSSRSSKI